MRKSSISELGVIHITYSLLSIQRIDIAQLLDHITSMEPAVTSSLRLSIIRVDQDHLDLGPHQRLASSITVFTMNMKTMTISQSNRQDSREVGFKLGYGQRQHQ